MNKEIFIIIFVSFFALGFLPFTENIVFGYDEDFSYKKLNKLERFGTEVLETFKSKKNKRKRSNSSTSTDELLKLIHVNKKKYNDSINKRIYNVIKSNMGRFIGQFERFINNLINDIKKNKDITDRIILGTFWITNQPFNGVMF